MNEDMFEEYSVNVDSDCVTDDFDNYDLYGERMIGDDAEESDIAFE